MPRSRSILAWLLVAPWTAWAVVRVLGVEGGFPGVALIAFTPYVVPLALVSGIAAAALRRWAPAAIACVTVLGLLVLLTPRAIGSSETSSGATLRVLTYNLFEGRVLPDALAELVREERVHVLCAQELTPGAARALERAGLPGLLPNHLLRPSAGAGGFGIYATMRLEELPAPADTSFAMIAASFRLDGAPVELLDVHAVAPFDSEATTRWRRDLRALPAAPPSGPVRVLAGDFNATLDHRELRDLLDRGYEDAAAVVGAGLLPTWRGGRAPWLTLDHVLVAERVDVRRVSVHRLPGSDHRAVLAELALPPG